MLNGEYMWFQSLKDVHILQREQIWIFTIFATALGPYYFGIYIKEETEISLEMTKQFLDFY